MNLLPTAQLSILFEKWTEPIESPRRRCYNHPERPRPYALDKGKVKVKRTTPQRAIKPGQRRFFIRTIWSSAEGGSCANFSA